MFPIAANELQDSKTGIMQQVTNSQNRGKSGSCPKYHFLYLQGFKKNTVFINPYQKK
jgi:hypothetical protein